MFAEPLRLSAADAHGKSERVLSAERENQRRRRQQAALAELGQAALTGLDVSILVGQICGLIEAVLETNYTAILAYEDDDFTLRFGVGTNPTFSPCNDTTALHRHVLLYALATNDAFVFDNVIGDPRLNSTHLADVHHVEAGACVPIPGRDGAWGVLTTYCDRHRSFAADELEFLKAVADMTGAMIANARVETARREAERARQTAEHRFRALIENSSEGIALVDAQGTFTYAAPSSNRLLGYPPHLLVGRNFANFVHPDELPHARSKMREMLSGDGAELRGEIRLRHASGEWRWFEGVYKNLLRNPSVSAIVINFRDVTERKIAEEQLQHLAYRDSLTNLPNRFLFHDRLEHAIEQARRRGRGLAVMYLDLDRFKVVNDTLGHVAGDRLLQTVAARLGEVLRADDTIARLGGDEFAVILPEVDRGEDAGNVGRKLLTALRAPIDIDGRELHVTASVGISMYPSDGEDVGTLLKHADAALYRSKDLGRNGVQLFASSMNARYTERMELELSLHRALDRQEFELLYQPLIDARSRSVRSFEALIRWNRAGHGTVSPADFIRVAEETRLILPIGEWVLQTACEQLRSWRDAGLDGFHVAVNLSPHQLAQPHFIHLVHDTVVIHGLSPRDLELEITEGAALQNLEWTLSVLDQLRSFGVQLTVDDFGTGQSSLVYLKRLPLHTLKIDREFLREVRNSSNDAAILASIIHLGHSLGLYVIAEGIETEADRRLAEAQGCDGLQGWFFGRPLKAEDVPRFVQSFRYPA